MKHEGRLKPRLHPLNGVGFDFRRGATSKEYKALTKFVQLNDIAISVEANNRIINKNPGIYCVVESVLRFLSLSTGSNYIHTLVNWDDVHPNHKAIYFKDADVFLQHGDQIEFTNVKGETGSGNIVCENKKWYIIGDHHTLTNSIHSAIAEKHNKRGAWGLYVPEKQCAYSVKKFTYLGKKRPTILTGHSHCHNHTSLKGLSNGVEIKDVSGIWATQSEDRGNRELKAFPTCKKLKRGENKTAIRFLPYEQDAIDTLEAMRESMYRQVGIPKEIVGSAHNGKSLYEQHRNLSGYDTHRRRMLDSACFGHFKYKDPTADAFLDTRNAKTLTDMMTELDSMGSNFDAFPKCERISRKSVK